MWLQIERLMLAVPEQRNPVSFGRASIRNWCGMLYDQDHRRGGRRPRGPNRSSRIQGRAERRGRGRDSQASR